MKKRVFCQKIVTFVTVASITLAMTPTVFAKEDQHSDIKVQDQVRADEQEIHYTDEGKVTYVVSAAENGEELKEKYDNRIYEENDYVASYQQDEFTVTDLSKKDLQELNATDGVIVEKDYLLEGSGQVDTNWQESLDQVVDGAWNVKAIHVQNVDEKVEKKVKVAVLDSGMDRLSAQSLAGGVNFIPSEEDSFGCDGTGHGTAVQNIILSDGSATESVVQNEDAIDMYSVKVLDEENQAPVSRIVAAIHWCIENDMDIINMSFGTLVRSKVLEEAIKEADQKGILMIAAAGNGGETDGSNVEYPAAYSEVLAVGSVNQKMEVSNFSARGGEVDLVAPGENIPVSMPLGFYGLSSGTSFAAPHVTAMAALLWSNNKEKTAKEIKSLLCASANTAWTVKDAGNGLVDYAYAEEIAPSYDVADEEQISQTNDNSLNEYAVSEIVQARWEAGNDPNTYGTKATLAYSHVGLMSNPVQLTKDELTYLTKVVVQADDATIVDTNYQKSLLECRVLHAGRYGTAYSNYVAACRCLYNCAYLIEHEGYSKDQLKEYCNKHYKNSDEDDAQIKKEKTDLRIIVNQAWGKNYSTTEGKNLGDKKRRELNFLGFSLHLVADAFAHQFVIPKGDGKAILENTRLSRLNGVLFADLPLSDYVQVVNGVKEKIKIKWKNNANLQQDISKGTCVNKSLQDNAETAIMKKICHKYYCDNISYGYDRYNLSSKDAVNALLKLYGGTKVNKFDPRVFVNNTYTGKGNAGRMPVWDLKDNVTDAGYTPKKWLKNTTSEATMEKIWEKLSDWTIAS